MGRLHDQVAVVTGAATGIGRATAIELARRGCDVALATRANLAGLESTAEAVRGLGRRASLHQVDVSNRELMEAFPEQVVREHGKVNVLVNNAGVTLMGELDQLSVENLEWIVNVNLWGVIYGCRFFIPHIKRESQGHIANVSSVQGLLALTSQTLYVATKFAIRGFSEALRGELSPYHIGVSVHFPGLVRTEVVASSRAEGAAALELQKSLGSFIAKRAMEPEVCARAMVDGIERNKARVLISPESHMADVFKRVFPVGTDSVVARMTRGGIPDF